MHGLCLVSCIETEENQKEGDPEIVKLKDHLWKRSLPDASLGPNCPGNKLQTILAEGLAPVGEES